MNYLRKKNSSQVFGKLLIFNLRCLTASPMRFILEILSRYLFIYLFILRTLSSMQEGRSYDINTLLLDFRFYQ